MAALENRSVSNLSEVMADERWERLAEQQGVAYAKTVAEAPNLNMDNPADRVKRWEIIADNLSKAGFSWGCVSTIDSSWRTIWIADALPVNPESSAQSND